MSGIRQTHTCGHAAIIFCSASTLWRPYTLSGAGGYARVMVGERGVRSFDTQTRSLLDLSAVPVLKRLSHLPVIVDPSHAAGKRELVPALARAAVAAGADGLMIEVHQDPERALSDGRQSLAVERFAELMQELARVGGAVARGLAEVRA